MYTFSIVAYIVDVYKFSGTHFIFKLKPELLCSKNAGWARSRNTWKLKWVPENLYTFTIYATIEKVYIFSGTHFILATFHICSFIRNCSRFDFQTSLKLISFPRFTSTKIESSKLPPVFSKDWDCCFDISPFFLRFLNLSEESRSTFRY